MLTTAGACIIDTKSNAYHKNYLSMKMFHVKAGSCTYIVLAAYVLGMSSCCCQINSGVPVVVHCAELMASTVQQK